ncbi:MAG: DUF3748 domain-containing protein [Cyclobacteriaceae bacterium]|nr:DUF3748 domain-containing protein [Cyclobacteriaceae bacterium]
MAITQISCTSDEIREEVQITHDLSYNHDLDNNDNFSPDDQWLVYDVRTQDGGIGACPRIEKVNINTGEAVVMYNLPDNGSFGPGAGAVSYNHSANQIVFIHGLMNCSENNPYQQWRRTGVIIDDSKPGHPIFMDARDITPPFTPGALRGGTHRHEWSGDGQWIGYTYNDAILKHLEDSTGQLHNLRTIGVSKNISPVQVPLRSDGENVAGQWFSAIVVRVVANPAPGSDEISRAAGDSWVGFDGYRNEKGEKQRARAFIGTTTDINGNPVDEVFIVDIPEDITMPGSNGPLEGTDTTMPAPPANTIQRRLTTTFSWKYPGCSGVVRSNRDGSKIAFLAQDEAGKNQVFIISPLGGEPSQVTFEATGVLSNPRWHPTDDRICYVTENSIFTKTIGATESVRLTQPTELPPADLVWSHDGKTIAFCRMTKNDSGELTKQIFTINP